MFVCAMLPTTYPSYARVAPQRICSDLEPTYSVMDICRFGSLLLLLLFIRFYALRCTLELPRVSLPSKWANYRIILFRSLIFLTRAFIWKSLNARYIGHGPARGRNTERLDLVVHTIVHGLGE